MTSPTYKLVYFDGRGSVEPTRFVFAQAGVKYEDMRVNMKDWPKLKPTTPTGMLPVLEVDGVRATGNGPIIRFLAERFGLAGSSEIENLQVASLYDLYLNFYLKCSTMFYEKDDEKKALIRKQIETEHVPKYLGVLERKYQENNSSDGWIYGNKPTYVDFALYNQLETIAKFFPGLLDPFPGIRKMHSAVQALPNITAWLKARPVTKY